jgi:hypothetical protein
VPAVITSQEEPVHLGPLGQPLQHIGHQARADRVEKKTVFSIFTKSENEQIFTKFCFAKIFVKFFFCAKIFVSQEVFEKMGMFMQ